MRVCLNMIVKNEAGVIERCLRSIRPHIQCWAIADTGSTDGTQELIRSALGDLPGELIERPWVDFSTNRNDALRLAYQYGDYAFFIDADDVLETSNNINLTTLTEPSYAVEKVIGGVSSWIMALARLDRAWTWKGVLHEVLESSPPASCARLDGMRIAAVGGGARSRAGKVEKYAHDANVLAAALKSEPNNSRYVFYLGHSLRESGEWQRALDAYQRRVGMGGWDEEIYFSLLMIASLKAQLDFPPQEVVAAFLAAFRYRPQRADAPAQLAHYLNQHRQYKAARQYAQSALSAPPCSDTLMVNQEAYSWRPVDDLVVAAFGLGDFSECVTLCERLLADPRLPERERARVQRNRDRAVAAVKSRGSAP